MTSQEHRDTAEQLLHQAGRGGTAWALHAAQVHATLAVYEGMYELLGDDGKLDQIREILSARLTSR